MTLPHTDDTKATTWQVSLDDKIDETVPNAEAAARRVMELCSASSGRIMVFRNSGVRPWWMRALGQSREWSENILALEWYEDIASIVFFDEEDREYWGIDSDVRLEVDAGKRRRVAHGEPSPAPQRVCMRASMACAAAVERLRTGILPSWLSYAETSGEER